LDQLRVVCEQVKLQKSHQLDQLVETEINPDRVAPDKELVFAHEFDDAW